ncbi:MULTISPECIES: 4-hydroxybenzoate octaprenyltransferase [Deefgea]|uniref:4-hydroxybenzoate octaprenyltransferase n=1 Tax=Deefgea chitinilytica TaxID=570276 RepID=A0ABS2CAY6_9NEIS|nr:MULTISPECIES: 4-hydroxybenzoate octaprenyltransferase [Deefgea]MBM5571323.1 4-hydroxybenzoate octaprenyltransferase [Deefgea chitinilytica]MBM9888555.1 4-hydroxybenzoate octaprenyltransferase [Deefgea sp. CFH1-16]
MTQPLKQRLSPYFRLARMDKPIGTLLLLWPTLWGLWIAGQGRPDWHLVVIFGLGTWLMRSAGCVINDWADRDFDGHVERTQHRPLATGEIKSRHALYFAAALALLALLVALPLNRFALLLTIPALFLAATYPLTKRFFPVPQAYLGIAFSFGIPMAFAAQTNAIPMIAWLLMLANLLWTVAYDTEYAMVDKPDDLKIGIKTSAITFGRYDVAAVMTCFIGFLALMIWIGILAGRSWFYFASLFVVAVEIEQQYKQIRSRDRQACFAAFLKNNRIGAKIFLGLLADYLIIG